MSTKTLRKRIALVAVSALGFGLLSAAPSSAADTTLENSSVAGTIVATASTSTATGTFSLTLVEDGANAWDTAVAQTYSIVDKFGAVDTCEIKANDDGTPYGTITTTGVSTPIFATASGLPDYTITSGDLVVTFDGDDNSQVEHITISGLTVKCTTSAPVGNLYIKTSGATSEIEGALVTMTGSVNQSVTDDGTTMPTRFNIGTFPVQAAYEATNNVFAAVVNASNARFRETTSALTVSPTWATTYTATYDDAGAEDSGGDACTTATDQFEVTLHGLRTGDAIRVIDNSTATGFTDNTTYYAVVAATAPDCFGLASTLALAAAATLVNGVADGSPTLRYAGAGMPATLTIGSATDAILSVGSAVTIPASAATNDSYGPATSVVYLGKIGTVGSTYKYYSTGTATAIAAASSFTTTATAGEINIDEVTSGSINDGATTESVVLTLTNGVFYSAPTVTGASIVSTQTYPSATLSLDTVTASIVITGTYRFNAGVVAGSYLTYSVVVDNDTDPVGYVPLVTAEPALNQIAILAGATLASTPAVSINISTTTGAAMSPITIKETAAGVWKAGQLVGACFVDGPTDATADEDGFYTSGGSYPWGTVTTGDVKLAGNVTTKAGTLDSGDDIAAASQGLDEADGLAPNQCVYWTVYSTSTVASTITINASNATNTGAATTGPVINTAGRVGIGAMAAVGGGVLGSALVLSKASIFTRSSAALFGVSLSSVPPKITVASSEQGLAEISITESAKGKFAASTIVIDLSDSALADSTGGSFSGTVGASAPVVTQTAASNIVWDYAVTDGNTITITVRTVSSDAPATFKISNVKINTVATKSGGVAPASSDFFYEISGGGMLTQTYSGQWATVEAAPAGVTNADVLKSIVALIASINKQIQALQKLILKR